MFQFLLKRSKYIRCWESDLLSPILNFLKMHHKNWLFWSVLSIFFFAPKYPLVFVLLSQIVHL